MHIGQKVGISSNLLTNTRPMGSCEMTHWQKISILQEFFPISLQNFQSRKGSVTSLSGSHSSRANFGLIWIQRHLQICKHRRLKMLPVFIAKNRQCLTVLKIRKARSRHLYISYSLKKLKGEALLINIVFVGLEVFISLFSLFILLLSYLK